MEDVSSSVAAPLFTWSAVFFEGEFSASVGFLQNEKELLGEILVVDSDEGATESYAKRSPKI